MAEINIRSYKAGDEIGISKLLNDNTQYLRDSHFWTWINRILPVNDSIIVVAELNDEIIGHYAILPMDLIDGNSILKIGLGIHAFVHPNYRDKLSIFSISALAYEQAKKSRLDFLIGFPNKNYRLIQEKIERWKRVDIFHAMEYQIDNYSIGTKLEWNEVSKNLNLIFPDIQRMLSLNKSKDNLIKLDHNINFWINRYFLHPQKPYLIYIIGTLNNIKGVVILKPFSSDGESRLHLIESVTSDDIDYQTLISDLKHLPIAKEVDKIVLWPENNHRKSELKNIGFTETGFDTFFGLKELNKDINYDRYLDILNWHLTMGDSDAF